VAELLAVEEEAFESDRKKVEVEVPFHKAKLMS
jgi:hypothetical protein